MLDRDQTFYLKGCKSLSVVVQGTAWSVKQFSFIHLGITSQEQRDTAVELGLLP